MSSGWRSGCTNWAATRSRWATPSASARPARPGPGAGQGGPRGGGRRWPCTCTTPAARAWPTAWPAWRKGWRWSMRRSPAPAAAPTRRAPAATSPPRTWSTCCTGWASAPASTWAVWSRPAAGWRRSWAAVRAARSPRPVPDGPGHRPGAGVCSAGRDTQTDGGMDPDSPDTSPEPAEGRASTESEALLARLEQLVAAGDRGDPALLSDVLAELKRLREEAERQRRRYRNLFNAVPDPISILDREGRILDLNEAGNRAYRRPREEIVGKLVHVLNPDLPPDHMGPVLEALDAGQTYVVEVS